MKQIVKLIDVDVDGCGTNVETMIEIEGKQELTNGIIQRTKDAIEKGANVLVVDDLLATGGTAQAACKLVKKAGGNLVGAAFLIELEALNGRDKLTDCGKVVSMLKY